METTVALIRRADDAAGHLPERHFLSFGATWLIEASKTSTNYEHLCRLQGRPLIYAVVSLQ